MVYLTIGVMTGVESYKFVCNLEIKVEIGLKLGKTNEYIAPH